MIPSSPSPNLEAQRPAAAANSASTSTVPEWIRTEAELLEILTVPSQALVTFIRSLPSPLLILGASGKMGPTLAVQARRAAQAAGHPLEIIAASRFTDSSTRDWLEARGIRTLRVDLLHPAEVQSLPNAPRVLYLAGQKFGTRDNPESTWATNTLAPSQVAERFADSQIVALSTGNVYPLVPVDSGGAVESHPLTPLGEYANAAVARERLFNYHARKNATPLVILRLNYAVELRYGVLVDLALKVAAGEPVDLSNGYFNCVWQADANDLILRSFSLVRQPPEVYNLTGLATYSVRDVAVELGQLLRRPVAFTGTESATALLSNAQALCQRLGEPPTSLRTQLRWIADWISHGGRTLNRPTHFEVRDGVY